MLCFLFQYFNEKYEYLAADPNELCKSGDVILIKELEEPLSDKIEHEVKKVIFPLGQITDPVTGKRCRGSEFIDDENRKINLVNRDT